MKVRLRLALLMTVALLGAGSVALLVNAITYQDSTYKTPDRVHRRDLRRAARRPRDGREVRRRQHPEVLFQTNARTPRAGGTINDAFQNVQRRLQRNAVNRSRDLDGDRDRRARDRRGRHRLAHRRADAPADPAHHASAPVPPRRTISPNGSTSRARTTSSRISPTPSTTCSIGSNSRSSRSVISRPRCRTSCVRRWRSCAARPTSCWPRPTATRPGRRPRTSSTRRCAPTGSSPRCSRSAAPRAVASIIPSSRSTSSSATPWPRSSRTGSGTTSASTSSCTPCRCVGDRALIDCLVRNLVDNAARHNRRRRVGTGAGRRRLRHRCRGHDRDHELHGTPRQAARRLPRHRSHGGRRGRDRARRIIRLRRPRFRRRRRSCAPADRCRAANRSCRRPRRRRSSPTSRSDLAPGRNRDTGEPAEEGLFVRDAELDHRADVGIDAVFGIAVVAVRGVGERAVLRQPAFVFDPVVVEEVARGVAASRCLANHSVTSSGMRICSAAGSRWIQSANARRPASVIVNGRRSRGPGSPAFTKPRVSSVFSSRYTWLDVTFQKRARPAPHLFDQVPAGRRTRRAGSPAVMPGSRSASSRPS